MKKRSAWGWFAVVSAVWLSGCATMSESECRSADWAQVGREDGQRGRTDLYLSRHRESCEKAGVRPDERAWDRGHAQGLATFCTFDNGMSVGRLGRSYDGICQRHDELNFLRGFTIGQRQWMESERIRLENERIQNDRREREREQERRREKEKPPVVVQKVAPIPPPPKPPKPLPPPTPDASPSPPS